MPFARGFHILIITRGRKAVYLFKRENAPLLAGAHKTINPTYGYDHRSDFCNMQRIRKGSLVQRELSAKLTEGLFYRSIAVCTNAVEISADFVVGNTDNGKSIFL